MRGFFVVFIAMSVLLLVGCGDKFVSKEWNQKMTVTVEIDGQTYVGSSVQRLQMNYDAERGPYPSKRLETVKRQNEAVIVDLKEHGYLFALWDRLGFVERYAKAYSTEYPDGPPKLSAMEKKDVNIRAKAYKKYLEALARPENKVTLTKYPELIMFEDISNPKSIKSFRAKGDNYAPTYHDNNDFKDVYGSDARVVSVVVENTKEPVRLGQIDKVFHEDFFLNWHLHAYGGKGARGPCNNSAYKKINKIYCTTRRTTFVWDGVGVGIR